MKNLLLVLSVILALTATTCLAAAAGMVFGAVGALTVVGVAAGYGAYLASEAT